MGNVLGAFLAAMLYDTVGPALLATLKPDQFQSTLDLNVRFLRPVRPGRLIGRGRVIHRNGDLALIEAALTDLNGVDDRGRHRDRQDHPALDGSRRGLMRTRPAVFGHRDKSIRDVRKWLE